VNVYGERTPQQILEQLRGVFQSQGVNSLTAVSNDWFAMTTKCDAKALGQTEFGQVMEFSGLNLKDSEVVSLFNHFDVDQSGAITYGEFSEGIRGEMPEFSASLAFMHKYTGHYKSNLAQIRAARPRFDGEETEDWLESLEAVVEHHGKTRARFLLHELMEQAQRLDVTISQPVITPMVNTIPSYAEEGYPGDRAIEQRISNLVRWNAAVMVSDGNRRAPGVGGHIGTFASVCDILEVLQNHFLRGKGAGNGQGDSIYVQGHASPGCYSRAFLEGRLDMQRIMNFRQEVEGSGVSSYPHPRLMPDFWENPTVSMGLGPLTAVYQARMFRYLHLRGLADTSMSRVWCFIGDGEMDESETISAIAVAGRERLNNLVVIVNCNYQRLDGPVRGNSKVIQEFEGVFKGAGFDCIKLCWGSGFTELIEADTDGALIEVLEKTPDGDCQRLAAKADGALIRAELFEAHGLEDRVAHLDDQELLSAFLQPGGHDHPKIYAALAQAERNAATGGRPTVILAKTLKGFSLETFRGRNTVHQKKQMSTQEMQDFRDILDIPLTDEQIANPGSGSFFRHPGEDSPEIQYMHEKRKALGGYLPERKAAKVSGLIKLPSSEAYSAFDKGSGKKAMSTTMAFAGILRKLMREPEFGPRCIPMVTDEGRTFGMESFYADFKIHAPFGQNYTPVDAESLMKYGEAPDGQVMQEGISEAGAMCTWITAGTSYASQACPTMPFFIFYSMFGFQRVADLIWQGADARARGFLLGATAGRTTLNGEGLQHQDGHSLLMGLTCPAVKAWDPAFAYELAAIIEHGVNEMWGEDKDVIYYIMLYNENFPMPEKPEGIGPGLTKGLYRYQEADSSKQHTVRLIGSGSIMVQAMKAAEMLAEYGVGAEIWSATNYGELHREAVECDRVARLTPGEEPPVPWVTECLGSGCDVTVAVSDHQTAYMALVKPYVGGDFIVLGTDGFGRSDTRERLRRFFEIDAESVTVAALSGLAKAGKIPADVPKAAIEKYGLKVDRPDICAIEQPAKM
jgi:pyruvate dehydrogenase E1 component